MTIAKEGNDQKVNQVVLQLRALGLRTTEKNTWFLIKCYFHKLIKKLFDYFLSDKNQLIISSRNETPQKQTENRSQSGILKT